MMDIDHWVQLSVLRELLTRQKARFAELNTTELSSDLFTFHLRHLTDKGLIEKIGDAYQLTPYGLEIASRLDVRSLKMVRQAKVGVTICIMDKGKILLGERLRDPQKGKLGFHSRKVQFGESLIETALKCLKDETGLEGDVEYAGEVHVLDKTNGADRLMTYFRIKNVAGKLLVESLDTKNMWMTFKQAREIENGFSDLYQDLKLFQKRSYFFEERLL